MDQQEIVRHLTQKGVIVTPEMLKKIKSGELDSLAVQTTAKPKEKAKPTLSVKIKKTERLSRMSPKDFVSYYNTRYEGLKEILLKKMTALSINKARETAEASVIGMVKEKNVQGFVLEDATGDIDVISKEEVREDDVVGVRGVIREGKLFQTEMVWPDVPLNHTAQFIPDMTLLLTTTIDENIKKIMKDFNLVFMPDKHETEPTMEESNKLIANLPNPCLATINKEGNEFNLLLYKPNRTISAKEALELLRRRHLSPDKKEIFSKTDPYFIEPVPSLFWIISDNQHVERYKGVTIIITKKQDSAKYDAETGKVYFAYDRKSPENPVPAGS
jgi:DNA polymerase II small subunit/DNA polymerase delta subunit B